MHEKEGIVKRNKPESSTVFHAWEDLMAMGVKPGPFMGKVLNEVRDLRLDGTIKSREDTCSVTLRHVLRNTSPRAP